MTQMILSESKEKNQNYCVQITSNQGEDGKQQLKKFCNVKEKFPVIAVTSKLMTTGVDAEMCKLIVLDTNVNSKTELKQIIGRGTRVYDNSKEMDKHYFTIMDFRQSTTSLEEDDWDSPVVAEDKEEETEKGEIVPIEHKKFRRPEVEGDEVSVITEVTKILDADSKTGYNYVEIKELMKTTIRTLGGEAIEDFKNLWLDLDKRHKLISQFESKGVSVDNIRQMENLTQDKYDLFDLFVKIAYDEKPKLRKIRAEQAKKDKIFFEKYPTKAQDVLNILLDHYAEYGYTQLEEPRKVLQLNKFEKLGGYKTILTQIFEEPEKFDDALKEIMIRVYK